MASSLVLANSFFGKLINPFVVIIRDWWQLILQGIGITILLSIVGTVVGLLLALVFGTIRVQTVNAQDSGIMRVVKKIGRTIVKVYVTVIRGTPMILQATIFYYGFYSIGLQWSALAAGLFTVSINTTAYLTEVIRGGLQSVDIGQMEAARSMGMRQSQAMRLVVFPQALKNSMAAIGNEFIINIKDTAVLSTITIVDLFAATSKAGGKTLFQLESMLIAAAIYLLLTFSLSKILMAIEKKIGAPVKEITSSN